MDVDCALLSLSEHMNDVLSLQLAGEAECGEVCSFARRARGAITGLIRYLDGADVPP